jgi:hypothetical protein
MRRAKEEPPRIRVQKAARTQARRDVSDEQAASDLRALLADVKWGVLEGEVQGWWDRDDYVDDRACRLLIGIRDGEVPAISPELEERFHEQARLGRMPLPEAFNEIARDDSTLIRLDAEIRAIAPLPRREVVKYVFEKTKADGEQSPALADSFLSGLVRRYLIGLARDGQPDRRSFFAQDTSMKLHGTLGGGSPV